MSSSDTLQVPGPGRLRSRRETVSREAQREASQRKAFSRWMNTYLPEDLAVENLDRDLRDGSRLCALAEALAKEKAPKGYRKSPQGDIQVLDNHAVWMSLIRDAGCVLNNIQAGEISQGNPKITLALLWTLIVRFQLSRDEAESVKAGAAPSGKSAKERLLEWVADVTAGLLDRPAPRNFDADFSDGAVLLALVKYARPDVVDLDQEAVNDGDDGASLSADPAAKMRTLDLAFTLAETHLGLPRLLEASDVAMHPDEMAVMTYVSYFRNPPPVVVRDTDAEQRCLELEGALARLRAENDALRKALAETQAELGRSKGMVSERASERDAARAEHRALAESHTRTVGELERAKAEQSKQREQFELLEARCKQLETAMEVIPGLESQIKEYENMLRDRESEAQLTEEQVREKEELLRRLGGQREALSQRIAEQDGQMESLQERVERLRIEREEAERQRLESEAREAEEARVRTERLRARRDEILAYFREGDVLWKYTHGGRGKAHERYFRLDPETRELSWTEKKDQTKGLKKVIVKGVHRGSTVANNPSELEALTFTIISPNKAGLALRAKSSRAYAMFVEGIPMVVEDHESGTNDSVPVPYMSAETGDVMIAATSSPAGPIGRRSFAPPEGFDPKDPDDDEEQGESGKGKEKDSAKEEEDGKVIAKGSLDPDSARVIAVNAEAQNGESGGASTGAKNAKLRKAEARARAQSDLTERVRDSNNNDSIADGEDNGNGSQDGGDDDDVTVVGNITMTDAKDDEADQDADAPDLHVEHVEGKQKKGHKKKHKKGRKSNASAVEIDDIASDSGSSSHGGKDVDGKPLTGK